LIVKQEEEALMAANVPTAANAPLLQAILNLSNFYREYEKFYASSPRELAVTLQRHARTLQALADQWTTAEPLAPAPFSPSQGAEERTEGRTRPITLT